MLMMVLVKYLNLLLSLKKIKRKNLEKENEELRKEKNSLKEKISKRLLELKFEKHNSIKTRCSKWFVKKYYQIYKNDW